VEAAIASAISAIQKGDIKTATFELECAQQELAEDVRDELGLYDWNREQE
jgi:hypothetical protein